MQAVIETPTYLSSAKAAKMTIAEQAAAIDYIAFNPLVGDLIVGANGLRKIRVAGKGKGKSGGYRIIYYYANQNQPIKLFFAFAKNQMANLTDAQLAKLSKIMED